MHRQYRYANKCVLKLIMINLAEDGEKIRQERKQRFMNLCIIGCIYVIYNVTVEQLKHCIYTDQ